MEKRPKMRRDGERQVARKRWVTCRRGGGGDQVSSISLTVMLQPDSPLLVAPEMLLQLAGGDIGQLTDS
jgi:hypothetical protein